jgi:hypothetical protein
MRRLKTLVSALVIALVVIASLDYAASAATGHAFVLGQLNKANRTTALKRTTLGPALSLTTTSSAAAPLAVNGRGRVANLNADRIDGLDSSALVGVRARVSRFVFDATELVHVGVVPIPAPGTYLATLDVAFIGAGGSAAVPTGLSCEFVQTGVGDTEVERGLVQGSMSVDDVPALSSATVLTSQDGNRLTLVCSASKAWTTNLNRPAEVTLTKLDGASFPTEPSRPESLAGATAAR